MRRRLWVAVVVSLLLHLSTSFWKVPVATEEPSTPLLVELREIPPPPLPAPPAPAPPRVEAVKPKPAPVPGRIAKAHEPTLVEPREAPPVQVAASAAPAPAVETSPDTDVTSTVAEEAVAARGRGRAEASATADASATPAASGDAAPAPEASVLPSAVDLLYSAFWGTHGVVIGTVAYRFEHGDGRYRIETVGEARGLIALLYPGQLKVASRGRLTEAGLLPDEFSVERGRRARHEVARFDRENGVLVLHDKDPQPLQPRTFDLLTFWLQFYFAPPAGDEVDFRVATTRSLREFRLQKTREELLLTPLGEVRTQVWRRVGGDDQDAILWLAPQWHFLPVKVRLSNGRGTVEQMLLGVRAGLEIPESMQSTRRLELPLDEEGNWVQEDKFSERALTP